MLWLKLLHVSKRDPRVSFTSTSMIRVDPSQCQWYRNIPADLLLTKYGVGLWPDLSVLLTTGQTLALRMLIFQWLMKHSFLWDNLPPVSRMWTRYQATRVGHSLGLRWLLITYFMMGQSFDPRFRSPLLMFGIAQGLVTFDIITTMPGGDTDSHGPSKQLKNVTLDWTTCAPSPADRHITKLMHGRKFPGVPVVAISSHSKPSMFASVHMCWCLTSHHNTTFHIWRHFRYLPHLT